MSDGVLCLLLALLSTLVVGAIFAVWCGYAACFVGGIVLLPVVRWYREVLFDV